MALLKKLAQQTVLYGLSSIGARLLTFIFLTPYLTYKFADPAGQAEMGVMTSLYAWAAFLIIPFTYRMETALFRFGSNKEDLPRAFRTAALSIVFSTTILVSLILFYAPNIASLLNYPNLPHYIIWITLIIALDALSAIPFALLRLQGKALQFALIKILYVVMYLSTLVFIMDLGPYLKEHGLLAAEYWYYDLGIGHVFVANLLGCIVMFAALLPSYFSIIRYLPKHRLKKEPFFDRQLWQKMMAYSLPLVLAGFAGVINEVLDRVLLEFLLGGDKEWRRAQIGIYGSCYKISIFMNLFTQAFNYAAEPFFFKNADRKTARSLYADISLIFTMICCIGFLMIMLFMDIIQNFVPSSYWEGIVIVPILLIANLFLGLYYNVAAWYKLADKTHFGAYIALGGATITLIFNILLIPIWGYVGSAWATLFCYVTMVVVCYLLGQRHYPIPYPVFKILSYIIMALIVYGIYEFLQYELVLEGFLGYLLSTILLFTYIGGLWKIEGKQLRQIIKR